jgi:membrane carboxypeptidase/penicillin-binding protein
MLEEGSSRAEHETAATRGDPHSRRAARRTAVAAPWYVEHVRRLLEERYGGSAPYQLGLQVYTAVDPRSIARRRRRCARASGRSTSEQGFRGPLQRIDLKQIDAFLEQEADRTADASRVRAGRHGVARAGPQRPHARREGARARRRAHVGRPARAAGAFKPATSWL